MSEQMPDLEGLPEGPWERDGACVFKIGESAEGRRGNRFYLFVWSHREFGGSPAEAESIARAIASIPDVLDENENLAAAARMADRRNDELRDVLRRLVNPEDFDKHPNDFMPVWHEARALLKMESEE